jgi:hypothetical protein
MWMDIAPRVVTVADASRSVILKLSRAKLRIECEVLSLVEAPHHDHVPVKPDPVGSREGKWCREHDDRMQVIGENAKVLRPLCWT